MFAGGSLFTENGIIAGSQIGCMATNILVVNNLRDIQTDSEAGKRTISNLLGYKAGRWELVLSVALTHVQGLRWLTKGLIFAFLLPLITLPYTLHLINGIFSTQPSKQYNQFLHQWSLLHLLFSFALTMGLIVSRPFS